MSTTKHPLIQKCEDEAVVAFGAEKIGTKELRLKLPAAEKEKLLSFLIQRLYEHAARNVYNVYVSTDF